MKYLVIGTGALGSVFGGLLQNTGKDVTFIGIGQHFNEIKKSGIIINGIWGEKNIPKIKAFLPGESDKLNHSFDVILLCVKSQDTKAALEPFISLLKPQGVCVSVQNGLGNTDTIGQIAGKKRCAGARVIFGVEINKPGAATVTVYADKVLLGTPYLKEKNKVLENINSDLNEAGIPCGITDNITGYIWAKALYNCALNPLGAILGVTYGELAEDENAVEIMNEVIEEIYVVSKEMKIKMIIPEYEEYISYFYSKLIPPTRGHHSSMYQDIKSGRKTEINALNGKILKYSKEHGLIAYANKTLYHMIRFKEKNF